MLYDRILRIIKNFDATFNELLGFDVLFEGWKVETSVDLVWTCLGWFSSNDLAGRVGPDWSALVYDTDFLPGTGPDFGRESGSLIWSVK